MILSVDLTSWKAYERLHLDLGPGTTFVVAQNGVGKSSLVQGAAWTLFGQTALAFPVEEAIRGEATTAMGRVAMQLPTGEQLTIERTVTRRERGGPLENVSCKVADVRHDGDQPLKAILERASGRQTEFLARLLVLDEAAVSHEIDPKRRFDLSAYIAAIFGTDSLSSASSSWGRLADRLSREADQLRRDQSTDLLKQIAERSEAIEMLDSKIGQLGHERAKTQESASTIRTQLTQHEMWANWETALAETQRRRVEVSLAAGALLRIPVPPDSTADVLSEAVQTTRTTVEAQRTALARAEARIAMISRSVEILTEASGACPVCLRALDSADASDAMHGHTSERTALEAVVDQVATGLQATQAGLRQLETLLATASALRAPTPPIEDRPESVVEDLSADLEVVANVAQELSERIGELRRERDDLAKVQDEATHAISANEQAASLYRASDLAAAAHGAADAALEKIENEHVRPLADELTNRWKDLWPDRYGLRLLGDGTLAFELGTRIMTYQHFSGAEKALSLVALRLLLVQMSSSLKMLWLDEPLEHLDPRNRRVLASLFASATRSSAFDQIVVTTYEEPVVRRIGRQSDADGCKVVYVRADTTS